MEKYFLEESSDESSDEFSVSDEEFSSSTEEYINFSKFPFPSFFTVFQMLKETKLPWETLEKLKPLKLLLPEGKDPRYQEGYPEYISKEEYSFDDSMTDYHRFEYNDLLKEYRQELRDVIFYERCKNKETIQAADHYLSWWKVCNNLKFLFSRFDEEDIVKTLDEGKKLFHQFSKLSKKYNEKECDSFWEKCKPKYGSVPYLFSIMKKDKKIPNLNRKELILK